MHLNDPQRAAVDFDKGPCLVLAGPGSGKTAVITQRIKKLIEKGVPAQEILVITFTKAAAVEMKERFNRLMDNVDSVTFGTFHSLFWGILQKEFLYKSSDILMGHQKTRIIKEAMELAGVNQDNEDLLSSFIIEISAVNCNFYGLKKYQPKLIDKEDLSKVYDAYNKLKAKYRVIDFDDMLTKAFKLFSENPDILKSWQSKFSYFMIDEMQDMNDIQFELIKMLSDRTKNIFCVGDDDQSIYGFRGSDPKIMQSFYETYDNCARILLNINYRNPENLVKSASKLIENNKNRFPKVIESTAEESKTKVYSAPDLLTEAKVIVSSIKNDILDGVSMDDIAVLYRNHSDARFVVEQLLTENIPFFLKEKAPNIYSHFIFSDLEAYFNIAIGNITRERMLRILNRPNRYFHRQSVEHDYSFNGMKRFYQNNSVMTNRVEELSRDINLISKMSPFAAANYIKGMMGYDRFLKEYSIEKDKEFQDLAEVFSFFMETVKDCKTIKKALEKINYLRLKIDFENKNKKQEKYGKIGLYTMHSSKGLEFKNVYIIGVNEGNIPSKKAKTIDEIEAERRLFYVGITRTKENLHISFVNTKNRDRAYPSRFIAELDIENYSSP